MKIRLSKTDSADWLFIPLDTIHQDIEDKAALQQRRVLKIIQNRIWVESEKTEEQEQGWSLSTEPCNPSVSFYRTLERIATPSPCSLCLSFPMISYSTWTQRVEVTSCSLCPLLWFVEPPTKVSEDWRSLKSFEMVSIGSNRVFQGESESERVDDEQRKSLTLLHTRSPSIPLSSRLKPGINCSKIQSKVTVEASRQFDSRRTRKQSARARSTACISLRGNQSP